MEQFIELELLFFRNRLLLPTELVLLEVGREHALHHAQVHRSFHSLLQQPAAVHRLVLATPLRRFLLSHFLFKMLPVLPLVHLRYHFRYSIRRRGRQNELQDLGKTLETRLDDRRDRVLHCRTDGHKTLVQAARLLENFQKPLDLHGCIEFVLVLRWNTPVEHLPQASHLVLVQCLQHRAALAFSGRSVAFSRTTLHRRRLRAAFARRSCARSRGPLAR